MLDDEDDYDDDDIDDMDDYRLFDIFVIIKTIIVCTQNYFEYINQRT